MSVQRIIRGGVVRYRARIKFGGREVATRVFDRKKDAEAWERDQLTALHAGDWFDPRRGRVPLNAIAAEWERSLASQKRKSQRAHESAWTHHISPKFGKRSLSSITSAEVSSWVGSLITRGLAPSTAQRYLATLRSILQFAVSDGRIRRNPAVGVKVPTGGTNARREGNFLTLAELDTLVDACSGPYADVVLVLGLCGLRWGELAGLQVRDRVTVPGQGLRLQRTVLADSHDGSLYQETLKGRRARTVPLPARIVPIVAKWAEGKEPGAWLFSAPRGGPLSEANWRRSVGWTAAKKATGHTTLRPHDLRHTAASVWLGVGADPKVVQRVLGHATASMTMDLYGHLIDQNLWDAAKRLGGTTGAQSETESNRKAPDAEAPGA